jgi:hypothetical protein
MFAQSMLIIVGCCAWLTFAYTNSASMARLPVAWLAIVIFMGSGLSIIDALKV